MALMWRDQYNADVPQQTTGLCPGKLIKGLKYMGWQCTSLSQTAHHHSLPAYCHGSSISQLSFWACLISLTWSPLDPSRFKPSIFNSQGVLEMILMLCAMLILSSISLVMCLRIWFHLFSFLRQNLKKPKLYLKLQVPLPQTARIWAYQHP